LRSSDDVAVYDRPVEERFSSVNFAPGTPPNPNLGVAVVGADGEFCYDNALSSSNVVLDLFAVIPAANVVSVEAERLLDTRTETDPAQFPWNPTAGFSDPGRAAAAFMRWAADSSSVGFEAFDLGAPVISADGSSATVRVVFDELVFDVGAIRPVQPVTTIEMVRQNGAWFVSSATSPSIVVERPIGLGQVPVRVDFSSTLIAGGLGFSFYADGVDDPFITARFRGGGIFAAGEFRVAIDAVNCVSQTFAFELEACTGPPPPNVWGTLVVTSSWAVETAR
jgi:hypothetical protein